MEERRFWEHHNHANGPKYSSRSANLMATRFPGTIIVVTHNSRDCIRACLQALVTFPQWKVVMVDNNSTDDTFQEAGASGLDVLILSTSHNVGFASAVNQAAKVAEGNALVILNPDTIATAGSLDKLGDALEGFFPVWFEDVDFCRRLRDKGWKIVYCLDAIFSHSGGHSVSRLAFRDRQYYLVQESCSVFCQASLPRATCHLAREHYRRPAASRTAIISGIRPFWNIGYRSPRRLRPGSLALRCEKYGFLEHRGAPVVLPCS